MMVDSDPTDRTEDIEPPLPGHKQWRRGPVEDNAGWSVFSYLLAGMAFYGLIGWLVSRATHIGILFPLGMIVGLILAIVLIIFRYGRP
jgi:ATP synthase protein I